jgi:murein DD-endopeptidase MepM/ murein hydrolase activator NlpD
VKEEKVPDIVIHRALKTQRMIPINLSVKIMVLCQAIFVYLTIYCGYSTIAAAQTPVIVGDAKGWPVVFELKNGEEFKVQRSVNGEVIERNVRLISFTESWEADQWIEENHARRTLCDAQVIVEVDGERALLHARPYQFPLVVNGLRLYVEATRNWAQQVELAPLGWRGGDVRFSAVAQGESWGPSTLRFPMRNYRWRSASYNNTWLSLVPYNKLYYHRGEDFGAVPDHLPVIAMLDGKIITSPLPHGDGDSNLLIIAHASGLKYQYAHMNIETIEPALTVGTTVRAGDTLGKTGMTWAGRKSQTHDPHLHADFILGDTNIGSYPFLAEAYLRDYSDAVLAVAGGYAFGLPGQTIRLDGSRSIAREGGNISDFTWRLHDGRQVNTAEIDVQYDHPGLYSEMLIVHTDHGNEDHDFLQVRIYDAAHPRDIAFGWFYHTPVRGIQPGDPVEFTNRLMNTKGEVTIDFGEGTPPQPIHETIRHSYEKPGVYAASLRAMSKNDEPATIRMRVVVEE